MKICMISLGCDKNLVDSEMMLGYLRREDVSLTDEQAEADVIIVNTCAFILDAKDESIQTMLSAAQYKEEGNLKALIMAGCMAERYKDEVLREIPEIDAVVGTSAYDKISAVLDRVLDGEKVTEFEDLSRLPAIGTETARVRTSLASYGYLKIAEGCDKHCTYCIIPSLRGRHQGTHFGCPGDDTLRHGFIRREATSGVASPLMSYRRHSVDTYSLLLSGGNHG